MKLPSLLSPKKTIAALILSASSLIPTATAQDKNIVETAVEAKQFTILTKALQAAGLVDALQGKGPFTVFAPTDEAFMRLPKGTIATLLKPENKDMLANILTYHVVSGKVNGATAVTLKEATALNKQKLKLGFKNAALYINNSKVIKTDIMTSNGVIHVVDNVILPPNMNTKAKSKTAKKSASGVSQVMLEEAIDSGVDLFNAGNERACATMYKIAVMGVLEISPKNLNAKDLKVLSDALDEVNNSDDNRENAWTLRKAMDKTLRSLSK